MTELKPKPLWSEASKPMSLIIADSHEIVREGISMRLTESCQIDVIGQAGDGYTTIKLCRQLQPDFLLMDLSLTRPSGMETFAKLRQSLPNLRIIVLSSEATAADAFHILSLGATGFLPKQARGADFVTAIQAAMSDYTCIPKEYLEKFVEMRRNVTRSGNAFGLSPREIEILEACARGQRSKEVAERLSISVRTVETHRNSIYRKTECRDLTRLSRIVGVSPEQVGTGSTP